MKSKIAILSCLAVAAVMMLPTVSAGAMNVWVYTDETNYTRGETVEINVDWTVTDPNDFDHDRCYVYILIEHNGSSYDDDYWGEYDARIPEATGEFPVYCANQYGFADHPWDTSTISPTPPLGDYTVTGNVTAYDYSQSPPNNVITGFNCAYFTLS